jgi:hypothetical protein
MLRGVQDFEGIAAGKKIRALRLEISALEAAVQQHVWCKPTAFASAGFNGI